MAKERNNESIAKTSKKVHLIDTDKIYRSIEELPLYNFNKIEVTGDLMWLYKDFNGRKPKLDVTDLSDVYESIFEEYFTAIGDRSLINRLQKMARKNNLEMKHDIVLGLIIRFMQGFEPTEDGQKMRFSFIETLEKWGYKIKKIGNFESDLKECETILNKLKSVKIQIALLQNELKQEDRRKTLSLEKQMILVSQNLQLAYVINPKKISTKYWCELLNILKEQSNGK